MPIIAALRPMRARRPQARLAMLSTAWNRTDPFWTAWTTEDLYERATQSLVPLVSPGPAFQPPPPQAGTSVTNPYRNLNVAGVLP